MNEFSFEDFIIRLDRHETLNKQAVNKHYQKGEYVFAQGRVCKDVFCMRSGLVKLYYNTLEGKEWIKSFVPDKGIIGSRHAQVLNRPSAFSAQCLEDTEMTVYPYELFQNVCYEDTALVRMFFDFTQWLGLKKEIREYQLLCLSAEEAYADFKRTSPDLVKRLTQIDLARYLGITPIALSRIKKRVEHRTIDLA